ncbi:hypothetical protein [Marinomonas spartinae]|uniref:phage tail fiber protein n=1 Tax=Marinomonas spartinae TaxID=1792290 RepID=UPI0018F26685|nr:hypothetical protein [Marinomonas spartinae]MBJ7556563.1 hypothetical protein [Marinomonas spartinae]
MATIQKTAALNLLSDGTNKDSTEPQMTTTRQELGVYKVGGVVLGLASEGWTTSIKEDANGDKTISLSTEKVDGGVIVRTFERGTQTPCDIVGALTLRFDVEVEVPDYEPIQTEGAA